MPEGTYKPGDRVRIARGVTTEERTGTVTGYSCGNVLVRTGGWSLSVKPDQLQPVDDEDKTADA